MLNVGFLLLWAQRGRMGVSLDSQVTYVITVCDSSPVPISIFSRLRSRCQLGKRRDGGGKKLIWGQGLESQTVITYVTCESRLTPIRPLWAHKSKKPTVSMPLSTRRNFLHTGKLNPETGIHFLSENPDLIECLRPDFHSEPPNSRAALIHPKIFQPK